MVKVKSKHDYSGTAPVPESPMDIKGSIKEQPDTASVEVSDNAPTLSEDEKRLWKVRDATSKKWFENSDHFGRMTRIRDCLDGKVFSDDDEKPSKNEVRCEIPQHKLALKNRIPTLIYQDPEIVVESTQDVVFEYDEAGQRKLDPNTGLPIKHDMSRVNKTLTALLMKKTKGIMFELRSALKHALAYNRGIFLIGHTINTSYEGAFAEKELFRPFILAPSPFKVRRQPGTSKIADGLYCFYDYQLPMSFLRGMPNINQDVLQKCRPNVLDGITIDQEQDKAHRELFDDVKWLSLHNAYDLKDGRVLVFGFGCDEPLWIAKPEMPFKNPFVEWIPNEQYSLDTLEPRSDLMDADNLIVAAHTLFNKICNDVMNYNVGLDVEESALGAKELKRLKNAKNRAVRVFKKNALIGGMVRERTFNDIPQGALAVLAMLNDLTDKTLQSFDFMKGGGGTDEKATMTALKGQYASAGSSDTANTFAAACNAAFEKFLAVCLRTITETEVVKIVGDKGEVEYPSIPPGGGALLDIECYVKVNIESARKMDSAVRVQQGTQLYGMMQAEQDPKLKKMIQKDKLLRKIAEALGFGDVIRAMPDTEGRSPEEYGAFIMQQHAKAQMENDQAAKGAPVLPPAEDDEDNVHLADHMVAAQQVPTIVPHMQAHIERLKQKEELESGEIQTPPAPQVAANPPTDAQMEGQAKQVPGNPPGLPQAAAAAEAGAQGGA